MSQLPYWFQAVSRTNTNKEVDLALHVVLKTHIFSNKHPVYRVAVSCHYPPARFVV